MHVLVTEDDPALAAVLTEFLEDEGHRVTHAADVRHARVLVRHVACDACILDPSGRSVLDLPADEAADVRRLAARVPVVITSGRPWAARKQPAELGVRRILTKPYDLGELAQIITSIGRRPRA